MLHGGKREKAFTEAARRPRLSVALGLAAGFTLSLGLLLLLLWFAGEVAEGESQRLDTAVLLWIHSSFPAWLGLPMRLATGLGYYWVVAPLALACGYAFYRRGLASSAVLLVVSTFGSVLLTTGLKAVYARPRPELFDSGYTASFYSFPSGHATVAVGFYGALALLLAFRFRGWRRVAVLLSGALVVVLIGLSRLYLGVHYPTDVLAGYLSALLWLACVGAALKLYLYLRRPGPGDPPA